MADFLDPGFAALVAAVPGLPIVLEHLGGLARPDAGDALAAVPGLVRLAALPNLALKLPGLGQLAPRRAGFEQGEDCPLDLVNVAAILDPVVAAFGPGRLLWGSDFPPVAAREGYAGALNWPRAQLASLGEDACARIFGGNALRLFWRN